METMNCAVFYEPHKIELEERQIPEINDNEVLIKVKACGICGSDIEYYFGGSPVDTPDGKGPLILGHEFTGEIVEMGGSAGSIGLFEKGDRVAVNPVQYCHACDMCKSGSPNLCEKSIVCGVSVDGAFSEYTKAHYSALYKLPDNVNFEQAAFAEPLSCGLKAVQNMDIRYGDTCAVIGSGAIGIMMTQLVKARGPGDLFFLGTRDYRLELGKDAGATHLINIKDKSSPYYTPDVTKSVMERTGGRGVDRIVVPTGNADAMETALAIAGGNARIIYFGLTSDTAMLQVPVLKTLTSDQSIIFSWLGNNTFLPALKSLDNGIVRVDQLISKRVPLAELTPSLKALKGGSGELTKILVTF